jgi:hypothetical protein
VITVDRPVRRATAHFIVQFVDGRLAGRGCRCRCGGDHIPDGRPALFTEPQADRTQEASRDCA